MAANEIVVTALRLVARGVGGHSRHISSARLFDETRRLGRVEAPRQDWVPSVLVLKREAVLRLLSGRRGEESDAPRRGRLHLAPAPSAVSADPVQCLPKRLGQVRFVEQNQAIRTDEPGVDRLHRVGYTIAAEQQARAYLVDGGAEHRRLGRRASPVVLARDAAAKAARDQSGAVGGKPLQTFRRARGHGVPRLGERLLELSRPRERIIHDQSSIHHEGDANRRSPCLSTIRVQRQMKDGDIDCRRLSGAGRQIEDARPSFPLGDLPEQSALPRERIVAVNLPEERDEVVGGQHRHPSGSRGRQSPSPMNRPAPRITGPSTGRENLMTAWVS
jgi:hypothetical protein